MYGTFHTKGLLRFLYEGSGIKYIASCKWQNMQNQAKKKKDLSLQQNHPQVNITNGHAIVVSLHLNSMIMFTFNLLGL